MICSIAVACTLATAKPVAVMVHGAGGGGWEYKFWKPVFEAAGYRVVAPDLIPVKGGYAKTTFDDYVKQIVVASGPKPAVIIGASMGGILVLKAAEELHPGAIVLLCSTSPAIGTAESKEKYPPVIRWKGGSYQDTVDSMPDSDEATRKYAHPRWRDESGAVLNAISAGIKAAKPKCPVLSVIPEADDSIEPAKQQALASWAKADTMRFAGMSHVGPLLSKRGTEVARAVVAWLRAR